MTPRQWLASLEFHGVKLGLENITLLLEATGRPDSGQRIFHIAGTNGKGSVAAFIDAILRSAGYGSARFTSPHIIDVNERFLIDGSPVDDAALDEALETVRDAADSMPRCPTYFEATTAVALKLFHDLHVDATILETGLGGRFDATTACSPIACAIASIGMDHTEYLGETIEKIAFEKAGIIKPDVPVVVAPNPEEALAVIRNTAKERGAELRVIGEDIQFESGGTSLEPLLSYRSGENAFENIPVGLAGKYQCINAVLAIATVEFVADLFPSTTTENVVEGIAEARWPCRLERVLDNPPVYIDIAHNADAAKAMAEAIPMSVIVMAVSNDKDVKSMAAAFSTKAAPLIVTAYEGRRALPVDELSKRIDPIPHERADTIAEAIDAAMARSYGTRPIVIAGSIFTAGQARQVLIDDYGARPLQF